MMSTIEKLDWADLELQKIVKWFALTDEIERLATEFEDVTKSEGERNRLRTLRWNLQATEAQLSFEISKTVLNQSNSSAPGEMVKHHDKVWDALYAWHKDTVMRLVIEQMIGQP